MLSYCNTFQIFYNSHKNVKQGKVFFYRGEGTIIRVWLQTEAPLPRAPQHFPWVVIENIKQKGVSVAVYVLSPPQSNAHQLLFKKIY